MASLKSFLKSWRMCKVEYQFLKDRIVIKNLTDFSLVDTFDCGQCFRFNKMENGHFIGVAFNRVAEFFMEDGNLVIKNVTREEFLKDWVSFLDLNRDYKEIKEELSKDEVVKKAIEYGKGIRILKQEFFECLISFIISQQNNIPKIKKAIETFCSLFGDEVVYDGNIYYTFPEFEKVKDITLKDLEPLKIGYRDKYIIDAIKKIKDNEISYEKLLNMSYEEAKKNLLTINGVGEKVANCVLLFSLLKSEAFPVDTWIKKAMESLYNLEVKEIPEYTKINFGKYSGFAQQYIFYYIRNERRQNTK